MNRLLTRASGLCALALVVTFAGMPIPVSAQRGFIVPDNARIEGVLNTRLNVDTARRGQRFTMRVTSPNEFRDAVVYGHVASAERSGRIKGKSEMALAFDSIKMRNGRTYSFAGDVQNVRTPDGDDFAVDDEGNVESGSQGDRTVRRTAIGAVAGTIIGALAGGGDGAATGAAVGGGVGAGSVLVQGRRNLDLPRGTLLTVRSSAPRN